MKNSILAILLISIFVVSCKDDKKEAVKEEQKVVDNSFKVTLNLLLKKNDTIHLYYTEDNTLNFNEKSSIWTPATGSDQPQDVVFVLPKDAFPTHFRIDLGVNKQNEKIVLKGFKFNYLDKSFMADENTLYNYFRVNTDNTNFDTATKELSRKDPSVASGPCLYPLDVPLKTEIDKLAK